MPGKAGTLETIAQQIARALQPLATELTPANVLPFLAQLGLQFPPALLTPAVTNALNAGATAAGALDATITKLIADIAADNTAGILADGEQLITEIAAVISALGQLGWQIGAMASGLGLIPAEVTAFAAGLVENLLSYLIVSYVETLEPGIVGVANLLGVVDYIPTPGTDANHPDYIIKKLNLSNLSSLLTSPEALFQTLYQWGSPAFDGSQLLPRLGTSLNLLGVDAVLSAGPPIALTGSLIDIQANSATNPPGLLATLTESLPTGINLTLPVTSTWSVQLQVQGTFAANLQVTVTPPVGISAKPPSGSLSGALTMNLVATAPDASHPLIIVGETGGSYLGANSISLGAGLTVTATGSTASVVPQVQFAVTKGTVFIDMSEADGFLSSVIGGTPIQASFEIAATWQPDSGLHITGGAQLEIDLPLHLDLGPVSLPSYISSAAQAPAAFRSRFRSRSA